MCWQLRKLTSQSCATWVWANWSPRYPLLTRLAQQSEELPLTWPPNVCLRGRKQQSIQMSGHWHVRSLNFSPRWNVGSNCWKVRKQRLEGKVMISTATLSHLLPSWGRKNARLTRILARHSWCFPSGYSRGLFQVWNKNEAKSYWPCKCIFVKVLRTHQSVWIMLVAV